MYFIFNLTFNISKIVLKKWNLPQLLPCFERRTVVRFYKMDLANQLQYFEGVEDRFHGITVDSEKQDCKTEDFPKKLEDSLKYWSENNKRGIWFKVGLNHADWVPILANKGFNFHHANPGYVMMYYWLPSESCSIPSYAHTMVGVGAIVVNDNSEILVVREKYFLTSHWKLPGGLVEPGEDLVKAAIREVKEETNIDTTFVSLISLRHAHKTLFNCSDMYIVFSLKAVSNTIEKCSREIIDCCWMNIQDFLNNSDATELNKLFVQSYLDFKKKNIKIERKEGFHQILKKSYCVYSVIDKEDKE